MVELFLQVNIYIHLVEYYLPITLTLALVSQSGRHNGSLKFYKNDFVPDQNRIQAWVRGGND